MYTEPVTSIEIRSVKPYKLISGLVVGEECTMFVNGKFAGWAFANFYVGQLNPLSEPNYSFSWSSKGAFKDFPNWDPDDECDYDHCWDQSDPFHWKRLDTVNPPNVQAYLDSLPKVDINGKMVNQTLESLVAGQIAKIKADHAKRFRYGRKFTQGYEVDF